MFLACGYLGPNELPKPEETHTLPIPMDVQFWNALSYTHVPLPKNTKTSVTVDAGFGSRRTFALV